mgnify:CR=1 FL=1
MKSVLLWKKTENDKQRHGQARRLANHWLLDIENGSRDYEADEIEIVIYDLGNPRCWKPIKSIVENRDDRPLVMFVSQSGPNAEQATLSLNSYVLSHSTISERKNAAYKALSMWIEDPTQTPSAFKTSLLTELDRDSFDPNVTREAQRLAKDHNYYFYYEGIPHTPVGLTLPSAKK